MIDAVTAEELIGAFTGKHGLDLRCRNLVHEVQRHGGRVSGRLVHVPLHARQALPVLVLADVLVGVGDVQLVGKLVGPRDLVAHHAAGALGVVGGGVLVAIKAHGERLDIGVFLGQAGCHVTGVDARGQKAADLDIGHVMVAHAVAHGFVDGLDGVLTAALRIEVVLGTPVAALGDGPVGMHGHAVRGSQLEDALEERLGKGAELEAQVLFERFAVELARVVRMLEDALDLGSEDEAAVLLRVIERLDAEEVAGAEQLARVAVPDGEREHAAQAVEHAFAPCQIAREQDFGVGVGLELPALRLELGAQIAVVVDLAVEHDGEAPLGGSLLGRAARGAIKAQRRRGDDGGVVARGAHHGLVAVGKVDERKTAMAQGDAAFGVDVLAFAVGPAMGHDVAHGFQCGQACIISLRESADTAHGEASLQSYIKVRFIITNGADGGTPPAKSADFPTSPRRARRRLCGACYTAGKESLARKGRLRWSAERDCGKRLA